METPARFASRARHPWVLRATALLRIAVGIFFANEAVSKIRQGWLISGSGFARSVKGYPSAHSGGFYHHFVADVILAHASLFAVLTTLAEWAAAISLTLGLLTRAGALLALWLNLNFMLLRGFTNPSGTLDKVFVVIEIVLIVAAAGRVWGLDRLVADRLARIPLAAWLAGAQPDEASMEAARPVEAAT